MNSIRCKGKHREREREGGVVLGEHRDNDNGPFRGGPALTDEPLPRCPQHALVARDTHHTQTTRHRDSGGWWGASGE